MTNPAKPRDPRAGQRQQGPAPSPPPRWWGMIFYVGVLLTLLLFLLPVGKTTTTQLSYTQFLDKVTADQVKTATIDPNGSVSGTLSNGAKYSTQIPAALQDTNLGQLLREHKVNIVGKSRGSNAFVTVLGNLLPILLFFGVI